MFELNKKYLIAFGILFFVEVFIALVFTKGFIRFTFGDFLVVILLYCFFKSFIKGYSYTIAILVLIISYSIEYLQYIHLLEYLGLQHNTLAKLILGSTFQVHDLIAYTLGIFTVIIFEYKTQTHD